MPHQSAFGSLVFKENYKYLSSLSSQLSHLYFARNVHEKPTYVEGIVQEQEIPSICSPNGVTLAQSSHWCSKAISLNVPQR